MQTSGIIMYIPGLLICLGIVAIVFEKNYDRIAKESPNEEEKRKLIAAANLSGDICKTLFLIGAICIFFFGGKT